MNKNEKIMEELTKIYGDVDSFLEFSPDTAVLLNIDDDHLDYFSAALSLTDKPSYYPDLVEEELLSCKPTIVVVMVHCIFPYISKIAFAKFHIL